ncbi:MAG: acylphosphatase [Candidatus Latescibacteria bacterium]|nr:acylphosphatase [Candidatus Latescibacterota bacterium]
MMSTEQANLFVLVSGVVQVVGFRFFVRRLAHQYGLSGTVRNLPNGKVEIEAEGARGLLQDFLKEVRRGPASGYVSGVEISWRAFRGAFSGFDIRFG